MAERDSNWVGLFAIVDAAASSLILLSTFDTYHHTNLHDVFLFLFIGGYIVSAIFLQYVPNTSD